MSELYYFRKPPEDDWKKHAIMLRGAFESRTPIAWGSEARIKH